jgi:hypothetical protein
MFSQDKLLQASYDTTYPYASNIMILWDAATVRINPGDIQILEELYTFRERRKVIGFLETYPFLVSLLLESHYEVQEYFEGAQLFLEVFSDPEKIEKDELIIYISTNLPPAEANRCLLEFDKNWWLKVSNLSHDKLCIDVEYI